MRTASPIVRIRESIPENLIASKYDGTRSSSFHGWNLAIPRSRLLVHVSICLNTIDRIARTGTIIRTALRRVRIHVVARNGTCSHSSPYAYEYTLWRVMVHVRVASRTRTNIRSGAY